MSRITWKPGRKDSIRKIYADGKEIGTISMITDDKGWRYWVISSLPYGDAPEELSFHCYPTPAEAAKALAQWIKSK